MALQMDYVLSGGISITNAYLRISKVVVEIDRGYAQIWLKVYKDKAAGDARGKTITEYMEAANAATFNSFLTATDVSPLNNNHVSQSYLYLKTLSAYANATDV